MTVRAKFTVTSITRTKHWDKAKGDIFTVRLSPVTGGSEENKAFYEATPGGSMEIGTINEEAVKSFPLGGAVYIDFTPDSSKAA